MKIFVTVGMGPWPFDRLLRAIIPLCDSHDVFAQSGTSQLVLPCRTQPYLPYSELVGQIESADVVITHAGNTVRLVQRSGKVPIVMARQAPHEMANDHQVEYLQHAQRHDRVVAVWDGAVLPDLVAQHPTRAAALCASRPLSRPADARQVADLLDRLWTEIETETEKNPFRHSFLRNLWACGRRRVQVTTTSH